MFWLVITVFAFFILLGCKAIIFHDRMSFGDVFGFTALSAMAGLILTGVISLCLMHSAPSVYIYEHSYDLVPIAEGIYGYNEKNSDYSCVCYTEEDGRLIELSFHSTGDDVIYTNDYKPHYYECKKDYANETLQKLFWKCGCENLKTITLPLGSIIEEP